MHNASTPVSNDTHNPATTTTTIPSLLENMLRGAIQSLTPEQLLSLLTEEQKQALAPSKPAPTMQEEIDALEREYPHLLVVSDFDDIFRKYSQEDVMSKMSEEYNWIVAKDWNELTIRHDESDIADALRECDWKVFDDDNDIRDYAKDNLEMVNDDYEDLKAILEDDHKALVFDDDNQVRDYLKDLGEDVILNLEDELDTALDTMCRILGNEGYTVSKDMVVLQPSVIEQVVALLQGTPSEG